MKQKMPTNNPAIAPVEIAKPPRTDESEIPGKNVKDQKITKTIFAAVIDTTTDTENRNIFFEFIPVLI
jgi:hypothetical protein